MRDQCVIGLGRVDVLRSPASQLLADSCRLEGLQCPFVVHRPPSNIKPPRRQEREEIQREFLRVLGVLAVHFSRLSMMTYKDRYRPLTNKLLGEV
jgi:hypothetical protein